MLQFQQHLFHSSSTWTSRAMHYDVIYNPFPINSSNRTGTSVDNSARKSNNWPNQHCGKTHCAWAQNLTSGHPVEYINQLRNHNIAVTSSLKAKGAKQTKKGAKKSLLSKPLASNFCTTWLSVCANAENDVWSLQVASTRQDELFSLAFLHATGLA